MISNNVHTCIYVCNIVLISCITFQLIGCLYFRGPAKKKSNNVNEMPEGVETIGSSSSQDEGIGEDAPSKFRKRRKILRKTRTKHKSRGM